MNRNVLGKATFVALAAAFSAVAVPGCSSSPKTDPTVSEDAANKGIIALAIQVAPGLTVNTVAYTVTGNGQNISGNIDTSDPNSTPSVQLGLPAGTGYTVSMTATSTSGVHCAGSQTFSVTAGATSSIFVNLQCDSQNNGDNIGGTIVNGVFIPGNAASCPDVAFYTVSPLATSTGSAITLNGGGTAGATTTVWTADQGTVASATLPNTTFVCAHAGPAVLTFTVTDGKSCTDSQTVTVNCINPGVCGNGTVEAGEQCDDGNTVSGDGCSALCQHEAVCGDGVTEGTEQCDPPLANFCSPTCQHVPPVCGNGVLQPPETCDDGNTVAGDGCSATCTTEAPNVCGDGTVGGTEQCDDGNTVAGDGCSATCTIESPCGNGRIDPGEECDPAGIANANDCSATCHLAGTACSTCETTNCGGTIDSDCTTGANPDLCIAAVQCARVHACYQLDPAICYCGATDIVACQGAAGPAGPCISEYNAAAGSTAAATVLLDLTDPSTALGRAGFIQQCDNAFCQAQCN